MINPFDEGTLLSTEQNFERRWMSKDSEKMK